ncbi:GNAT family N-acetyltransferase [Phytomonospora endophytica]|uniref:Ribosomal-protein-alanine N-acetyltransferase n=1 Tax=Phytomonospora endophytica TaxID=714109 RepID=A0A841FFS7_9ACTN|nr:GNAT family N-acetyltransferase [Phytomonospora endophytica]MBB6033853.1 ribosomal-protein-alanine N-acetyltransferase [Phytomonospora endophytica]GIG64628.1 N-acetyltransferase [Phytomonospora endophytica]
MPALQLLREDHAPAVLAFEKANRAFFAETIPDRGDDYFTEFADRHAALLAEQATGTCFFHVLADDDGTILGRFNLVDAEDGEAELGYRLAEAATGKGLATAAVRELCTLAANRYGLTSLRAGTGVTNTASQGVLTRTGFSTDGIPGPKGLSYRRDLREFAA